MSFHRPFFHARFPELREAANREWSDYHKLRAIADELARRTTANAARLRKKIQLRIRQIEGKSIPKSDSAIDKLQIDSLRSLLKQTLARAEAAESEVARLRSELKQSKPAARKSRPDAEDDSFGKYGIVATCDPFVFEAVWRAYRRRFHPDSFADRSEAERNRAKKMFQQMENDFEAMQKTRRE